MRIIGMVLFGALVFLFVVLSWAPFELEPPVRVANAVTEQDDVFVLVGPSRLTASTGASEVGSGSLQFGMRYPCREDMGGRIVTLSTRWGRPLLSVDQVDDRLLALGPSRSEPVALRGTRTGQACDAWLEMGLDLSAGEITLRAPHTTQVTSVSGPIRRAARIDFGTPLVGDDHWSGEIRQPRLLTAGASVDLTSELHAPASLWVLPSRLLGSGERDRTEVVEARLWHAFGGVLLGLGLGATFPRVTLRRCLAGGLSFVVVLNLGKILVAYRHPSLGTALLQAGGLGLGAACTRFTAPGAFLGAGTSKGTQSD